jgi:hypothetical protein
MFHSPKASWAVLRVLLSRKPVGSEVLPAGLDENESASFADDASACLHAYAKQRRLMTAVTDRRAPKCFLWNSG